MNEKKGNRLKIKNHPGAIGVNYPFLSPNKKRIGTISNILDPESIYDPKRKKGRALQNLVDYREFIKRK